MPELATGGGWLATTAEHASHARRQHVTWRRMSPVSPQLRLPPAVRERLHAHAARCAPAECCGALVGRRHAPAEVVEAVEAANLADGPAEAFVIDPAALLEAERRAAASGLEVLGCYHSHPRGPAWPSARDASGASRAWTYVIVSGGGIHGFRLDERGAFVAEALG